MAQQLVISPNVDLVRAQGVPELLSTIRPVWQAKSLIDRVRALMSVDPSSACQRLLNAAIHDLREKVKVAGIDIAREAAQQAKLPPITKDEDVQDYSTSKLIELSHRMGLLTRPEYKRLSRCYEIRRDLEHEDDEYEATVEDCYYIFKTCIEVVLSKDPIQLVRMEDFVKLVEQATQAIPDAALIEDFNNAPQPRQEEIGRLLLSKALDKRLPDIVQQNAFTALSYIRPMFHTSVRTALGTHLQGQVGRAITDREARVAFVAGLLPYIRQAARAELFSGIIAQMNQVGSRWSAHGSHGELLRSISELGGLECAPSQQRSLMLKWLVDLYIGESGGRTQFGNVRNVFYSNTGAPIAQKIIRSAGASIHTELNALRNDKDIKAKIADSHISRRFEDLVDQVDGGPV